MRFLNNFLKQLRAVFQDYEDVDEETLGLMERLEMLERENLFLRAKLERIREILQEKNDGF
jgi:hypothetical protein